MLLENLNQEASCSAREASTSVAVKRVISASISRELWDSTIALFRIVVKEGGRALWIGFPLNKEMGLLWVCGGLGNR